MASDPEPAAEAVLTESVAWHPSTRTNTNKVKHGRAAHISSNYDRTTDAENIAEITFLLLFI